MKLPQCSLNIDALWAALRILALKFTLSAEKLAIHMHFQLQMSIPLDKNWRIPKECLRVLSFVMIHFLVLQ